MAQVVLKGINKFYDAVHAVKDVNLQIRDKEFVVFVGPSGCGKTTTLAHDRRARGDHLRRHLDRRRRSSTNCRPWTATSPWCSRTTRSTRT